MKIQMMAIVVLSTMVGCTKGIMDAPTTTKGQPGPIPRPTKILQRTSCIYTYQDLVSQLGGASVAISAVELEDGTYIKVGGFVNSMVYEAVNVSGPSSIFRSELKVSHRYWGYDQLSTQSSWSLGCKFATNVTGTKANLYTRLGVIQINAGLVWSAPSEEHFGKRIRLLFR